MSNILISVIVPVYNTSKYLHDCLTSIVRQTYNNIEIILIDDCSLDDSAEICKNFAEQDSRISFIKNNKNMGVSATRNKGIQMAKGDYLLFVDSDDMVDTTLCEKAVAVLKAENADTVHWGYKKFKDETGKIFYEKDAIMADRKVVEQPEISDNMITYFTIGYNDLYKWFKSGKSFDEAIFKWKQPAYCYRWMFSKKIIIENEIRFREDIGYGEDIIFVTEYLLICSKVAILKENLSLYRDRPGSAMHTAHSVEQKMTSIEGQLSILKYVDKNKRRHFIEMRQGQFVLIALNGARVHSLADFRKLMKYNCIKDAIKGVRINEAPFKWKVAIGLLKLRLITIYYITIQLLSIGGFKYEH